MTDMNAKDLDAMSKYWQRETDYVKEKIDDACKDAMDHAYALGIAQTAVNVERERQAALVPNVEVSR